MISSPEAENTCDDVGFQCFKQMTSSKRQPPFTSNVRPVMLFVIKPCPNCGSDHGHTRWAVANSSVIHPLRCRQCRAFFHQKGLLTWLWVCILLPTGLLSAIHWSIGVAGVLAVGALTLLYINRRHPLVKGPEFG